MRSKSLGALPGCKMLDNILDRAGIPQLRAEELLETGKGDVSRILSGKKPVSLELAIRIRDTWGIPPEAWLQDYKAPRKRPELLPIPR